MPKFILTDCPDEVLELWQERFTKAKNAYAETVDAMQHREALYRGVRKADSDYTPTYNIVAENIEAQIDTTIYPVKVTAKHPGREGLAKKIEHRLNALMLEIKAEKQIDFAERTVPIQGGCYWHIEWDESAATHDTRGSVALSYRHPQNVIPQEGACSVEEMEYIFLEIGTTRAAAEAAYGVKLADMEEDAPEARSVLGDNERADDFVTERIAYFRADSGSIGKIVWVGDILCFYMEDYESGHLTVCRDCGEPQGAEVEENKKICRACGGKHFTDKAVDTVVIDREVTTANGEILPAGTELSAYKPRMLPLVLQRSISLPNELFGASDVDLIEDQQIEINEDERRIAERKKLMSVLSLPPAVDEEEKDGVKVVRPSSPADMEMIATYDIKFDISQYEQSIQRHYEQARNLIGITDSYQGRYDPSAKSGVAKKVQAAQAAGRLASKRAEKAAALAEIYERMFRLLLAYDTDEHDVMFLDENLDEVSEKWSRLDFIARDKAGKLYFDDEFMFSCDGSLSILSDRESLWEQSTADYTAGLYGPPGEPETMVTLWKIRNNLHYPSAGFVLQELQAKLEAAQVAMQAMPNPGTPDWIQNSEEGRESNVEQGI